ncbi:MAG: HAD family hydrolase [Oscillospiraceae bacterium]|nr:HAD family hydrolase [Oscillospiraceae bacterium]
MKTKAVIFDMDGTLLDSMHIWQDSFNYQSLSKGYNGALKLKPGVLDFLNTLRENKIRMILATATDRHYVEPAIRNSRIADYFERIFTCGEVGSEKHTPLIYNTALEYLGLDKDEVWIFEDAHYAVKTAKQAGYKVVGVYDKWAYSQDKIALLSDIYIKSYDELRFCPEHQSITLV